MYLAYGYARLYPLCDMHLDARTYDEICPGGRNGRVSRKRSHEIRKRILHLGQRTDNHGNCDVQVQWAQHVGSGN